MSYTDYLFVPLFLIVALIYFLLPLKKRWIVLLAASLLFYATWGGMGFAYLIGAVLASWIAGLWMESVGKKYTDDKLKTKKITKRILWLGVAALILVLILVKLRSIMPESTVVKLLPEGLYHYALWHGLNGWFSEGSALYSVSLWLSENFPAKEAGSIIAPLGISYFTLSLVGYMADVYWRKEEAESNPLKLLLFAAYFPKILEGPISKHRLTAKGLYEGHRFDFQKFCFGLQRILWGFFKKLVIADRLALFTGTVFADVQSYHGMVLLVAAVFAAFELYCDFSVCMDMALGMSEALGIELEENFRRPFFSRSAAEFWRRWHISLGTWFKDYIYMPLVVSPALIRLSGKVRGIFGGNTKTDKAALPEVQERQKKAAKRGRRAGKAVLTVIPLACVWILTGLWHGTGWNYVVWGAYWGLLIILSTVFEPEINKLSALLHINTKSRGWLLVQRLRTFFLFVISRIISLPSSLKETGLIFSRIFRSFAAWELFDGTLLDQGLDWPNMVLVIAMIFLLMWIEKKQEEGVVFREKIAAFPVVLRWFVYFAVIFFVLIVGIYGGEYDAASFVYTNF